MYNTIQKQIFDSSVNPRKQTDFITIGTVVGTSDPQQLGRIKVMCPQWGDVLSTPVEDLPWVSYITPVGGDFSVGTRGPGIQETNGRVGYGFWSIPKVGAQVAVMCLDGDPMIRVYIGCLYTPLTTHTLPHGRFTYDDHPAIDASGPVPFGPLSTNDAPIEPLATNLKEAFGNQQKNFEWQTRAADYQVSAVHPDHLDYTFSRVPDDFDVKDGITPSDWTSTQGYNKTTYDQTELESKITSFTSPGFHSWSMDDRQENCRFRLRTTSGHQILMDDTNERIYISTSKGNNWVEMDQNGNIDVYSANKVNIHSNREINLTSDETIRMYAKKGIHMVSEDEIRMEAKKDVNVKSTGGNLRVDINQSVFLTAAQSIHNKAGASIYDTAAANIQYRAGGIMNLSSGDNTNVNSGGDYIVTAATVHHNGPTAEVAQSATVANAQPAMWTNRVPAHEPWPRTMTKTDFTHAPEHTYFSKLVNKVERGRTFVRGLFWRR